MSKCTAEYLRTLAPFTSGGSKAVRDALEGAAERIAELEAENARLREALDEINAYTEPLLGHSAHEMRDIAGAALKQEAGDE